MGAQGDMNVYNVQLELNGSKFGAQEDNSLGLALAMSTSGLWEKTKNFDQLLLT